MNRREAIDPSDPAIGTNARLATRAMALLDDLREAAEGDAVRAVGQCRSAVTAALEAFGIIALDGNGDLTSKARQLLPIVTDLPPLHSWPPWIVERRLEARMLALEDRPPAAMDPAPEEPTGRPVVPVLSARFRAGDGTSRRDAFLGRVTPSEASGCWIWNGAMVGSGAGSPRFFYRGAGQSARAAALELCRDIHVEGQRKLRVRCCNPRCVSPDHIVLGNELAGAQATGA